MRELVAHVVLGTFAFQLSVPLAPPAPDAPPPQPPSAAVATTPSASGAADFRQWSGDTSAWSVSTSGRAAAARSGAGPSLLIGPRGRSAFTLRASVGVHAKGGAAGFAFGRHAPWAGVVAEPSLVLTWTAAPAGAEIRGEWKLSRFEADGTETVHAHVGGSSDAYDLSVPRTIEIDSSPTHFRLLVAGEDVIDVAGSFPSSPAALYADGAAARFSDVEVQPLRKRASASTSSPALLDEDDPAVGATVTKPLLWPANHGYVTPALKVYATDPSGAVPTISVKVYSDEPDDQDPADGNLWPDVLLAQAPPTFRLRAERRSDGNGRVYLVQATAQGPNGSAFDCLSVVVPLTDSQADEDLVAAHGAAAVSHCDANGSAPSGFSQIAEGAYVVSALDQRVKPIVECVVPMGGNQYLAVFGYQNDNPLPATVPIGDDNKFAPLPIDRGQPIRFTSGHSPLTEGAFAFPFAGSSQTWSLRGPDGTMRTANASSNSTHCAFTPAVPVAEDDTAATTVGTPVAIPVLVNDSDPQSQPLSVARVTAPAHGTAAIETDGTVTYTPATGYAGADSFRYVAFDGAYGTDVATVTVTIAGASNQAPVVEAGADQTVTLPATAALAGTATDDGLPAGSTLSVLWSQDSGPGTATFSPGNTTASTATFSAPGTYVLRLTANDSALSASDTLTVVVASPGAASLSIGDVTVAEGHAGRTAATATVTLSSVSAAPVAVLYRTDDQTAGACDYQPAAGGLTFAPGETTATIALSVAGELLAEADETFTISLGYPTGATIADGQAVVTIENDDTATNPPTSPTGRTPAHGATGVGSDPTLAWTATDPDGDALTYDVYLGTALDPTGQEWTRHCPATAGPSARYGAASGYDETNDRLIVFGGSTAAGETADVWVLANATGLGGAPAWTQLTPSGGPPARQRGAAGYDATHNRLVVSGGCAAGCTTVLSDTWVLSNANGTGGAPVWSQIANAPAPRFGQAAAYEAGTGRLFVFGGSSGSAVHSDLWMLEDATEPAAAWTVVPSTNAPSAREGAQMAFDGSGGLFLVGGRDASGAVTDGHVARTASPENALWTTVPVEGLSPTPRWGHTLAFDPTTQRLLLFHGTGAGLEAGSNVAAGDAWFLDGLPNGDFRWTRIEPGSSPAPGRFLAASAYSPSRSRLVTFGGRDNRLEPEWLDGVWILSDPIGSLTLSSSGQSSPSLVAPTPEEIATYYWRVVARDVHGAENGSPVWTFAPNAPPVVQAGLDAQVRLPQSLALHGTASDDGLPAPPTLASRWSAGGDPAVLIESSSSLDTTVSFAAPGIYTLTLSASDGVLSADDALTVEVLPANEPPVVSAGPDRTAKITAPILLAGVVSDDGPAGALSIEWKKMSGPGVTTFGQSSAPATSVTFSVVGTYVLRLTASDGVASVFDEVEVQVGLPADLRPRTLDLSALVVDPQTLVASGRLSVDVANIGGAATGVPFDVTFFEDRDGDGAPSIQDSVLGVVLASELSAGASSVISASASGSLLFTGSNVHAFVDSGLAVPEGNETNNHIASLSCELAPPPPSPAALLDAQVEWSWHGPPAGGAAPSYRLVESVPIVADLEGDGFPEILVVAHAGNFQAFLRVFERAPAAPGFREKYVVSNPSHALFWASQLAVGNIDDDAELEIIGVALDAFRLIAFEHDGTPKWLSAPLTDYIKYGGPTLADLDGDGRPEIVVGRTVLNANGTLRWRGNSGVGTSWAKLSVVADIDHAADGRPEVITGNTVYTSTGDLLWRKTAVPEGYNAVGNFDTDDNPEIVVVGDGKVTLLEDTAPGTNDPGIKWGPYLLPGGGYGGPPTVANFIGDEDPEIGVAGASLYTVFDAMGVVKWSAPIIDFSSNQTGSTVFDFDGDGHVEVVYADEQFLRVFRGTTGQEIYKYPLGSATSVEYPVVADVDADGAAEIVAVANWGPLPGLYVIGSAGVPWMPTRRIWNQHSYRITSVNDDGTIPAREPTDWAYNNYRQNLPADRCVFARPDLTASFVRVTPGTATLTLTARIANRGGRPVPAGAVVRFHAADPAAGGAVIGPTVSTGQVLAPGAYEDVSITVPVTTEALPLWVWVDPANVVGESNETNNLYDSRLFLSPTPNQAPVVDAGPAQVLPHPQTATSLLGTVVDDGRPLDDVRVTWGLVSGPGSAHFADPTAPASAVTFSEPGGYVLRLTATDQQYSVSDDVSVDVVAPNAPPVVLAGPDLTFSGTSGAIDADVTDDGLPAGSTLGYEWSQLSGPASVAFASPNAVDTQVRVSAEGVYVLRLTATDGASAAHDDVQLLVSYANSAPQVYAGPDRAANGPTTWLDGTVTDDGLPTGSSLSLQWIQVGGPSLAQFASPHAADTAVTVAAAGTYVLRLTAADSQATTSDDVRFVATFVNAPPSVNAGPDLTSATLTTTLDGTVTDDGFPPGASAPSMGWTQIDGPAPLVFVSPTAADTAVAAPVEGTYNLRLTATDGIHQASDTMVLVVALGNHAPVVAAGPDHTLTLPTNALTLTGGVTDDGLPAPPTLSLAWSVVSGPGAVEFGSPDAAATSATFTNAGTYVVRLGATDGALPAYDDATINVHAAPPTGPPPVAVLTEPLPGTRLAEPRFVRGTAQSDSLASWQLEHRLKGDGPWVRFASGTTPIVNDELGTLDTTMLLNGITEIRLTVMDTAGRSAVATTHVVVKEQQKVGNFSVSFVDMEVPVAGLPIRVTRSYDSRDKRKGDFGHGWRLELSDVRVEESEVQGLAWQGQRAEGFFTSYCLASPRPPLVTLTLPDGRVLDFQMTLTPSCQPFAPIEVARVSYAPVGNTLGTLVPASGTEVYVSTQWPGAAQLYDAGDFSLFDPSLYRYTSPDGRVFLVHDKEGLKSLTDLNGNVLTVGPGGITHSSGVGIAFGRDVLGRITTVTDPAGAAVQYAYDANGDLASVTDRASHTTRFGYHVAFPHHLESIEDPLGRRPIRNDYDENGRLLSHTDAFGQTITYTHSLGTSEELVYDRTGALRVLKYDVRGNVVKETDPLERIVLRTYDARNNRLTETLPHVEGTPNPPTTTYTYDAADNVLSVTDPENNRTEFTYNARRQVLTSKDARGAVTTNVYDAKGNLTSTRVSATVGGPSLTETSHTYDVKGNLRTQTVLVDGVPQTTSYAYDAAGNLTHEIDASGHQTLYGYDLRGNRTRQTTSRTLPGGGTEALETKYEYDPNGRLLRTTDPDGTSTRSVYDPLGRQAESFDKLGRRTAYTYDLMGRLEQTDYADGKFEKSTYDEEGRRLTSVDRRGKTTSYTYDAAGRLLTTTFPGGASTLNTYDPAGRLTAVRDAKGKTTTYEYDDAGRRTKVTVPLSTGVSAETVFTYDANGNQLTVRDPLSRTTTFEYDSLNRRTKTIFPAIGTEPPTYTETTYDTLGRRKTERDQAGKVTTFGYDELGRLTSVTDALGKITTYAYDELGNRTTQTDANGHVTAFEYDRLGREIKRTLPAVAGVAAFETKSYDDAGRLESRTDFAGRETAYTYDVMSRLLTRCSVAACNGATDVTFTYTASGRRETATDGRGVTSWTYDDRDRLALLTYPGGRTLTYLYDGNGNRTSLSAFLPAGAAGDPLTLTTTYTHDDANRLDVVTDAAGRAYDHGYDANGNRTSLVQPNGTVTSYTYDPLNRLTNLTTLNGSTPVQSYALTLGPAGNRTQIVEGDTVRAYGYDELYRLTSDTVTIGALNQYSKGFTYDDVGNRQTQTTSIGPAGSPSAALIAGTLAYGYDERDRLTTETLDANPATTYGWDVDGNLISKSAEATYEWDREMRMVRVTKTDGTVVEHAYDFDGVRVQTRTTPAGGSTSTTNFLVDTSGSLSHVVAETNATGGLVAHYVRGDDLLAVMRPLVPAPASVTDWQTRYYHSDHIGSVRRLTDETGVVTDWYVYTAFGELLGHTGTDPQPYAFTGEPYDPNVGFQYHRARWMDPRAGRLASIDLIYGMAEDPGSLHRYVYATANPVNRGDPSGLVSNFLYGRRVHEILGVDFVSKNPGGRDFDLSINSILEDVLPYFGKLRPDLIDYANKQIFEIKTVRQYSIGVLQLQGYLLMLNWADPDKTRPWTVGVPGAGMFGYTPIPFFPVGALATAVTVPPIGGVITYEVFDALPIILGLAALAAKSMSTMGAQVGAQAGQAIMINTLAPVG